MNNRSRKRCLLEMLMYSSSDSSEDEILILQKIETSNAVVQQYDSVSSDDYEEANSVASFCYKKMKENIILQELSSSTNTEEEQHMIVTCIKSKKMSVVYPLLSSSSDTGEIEYFERRERPKIHTYIDVIHEYTDQEFKETFRLSREMTYRIIEEYSLSEFSPRDVNGGVPAKTAEEDVLCFLWFVGNKCCLRDVAERFGVGVKTAFCQHLRVMDYLMHIAPNVIKFPDNVEEIAHDFYAISHFPNIIGCIDGSYIPILTPKGAIQATYINRHDQTSMTLQGICDAKMKFLDVFTGPPGRMHDARIFELSTIREKLPTLCNDRYHILGDGAYPLREWLMVPFRDTGRLTPEQVNYNKHLSRARVLIENTFGLLKMRFRQLFYGLHLHEPEKITKFIICCCVLHNLCIMNGDEFVGNIEPVQREEVPPQNETDRQLQISGQRKRQALVEALV